MASNLSDFMVRARGPTFGHDRATEGPAEIRILSNPGVEFEVSVRLVDRFAVIRLERPSAVAEVEGVGLLRAHLSRIVEEGHLSQILDLGGVECASATLVTCLASHHCRLRKREGTFRLHGVGAQLSSALGHCGLLGVLEVYEDEDEALGGGHRLEFPS
jgi:anti-anti-sigma regulatory factor